MGEQSGGVKPGCLGSPDPGTKRAVPSLREGEILLRTPFVQRSALLWWVRAPPLQIWKSLWLERVTGHDPPLKGSNLAREGVDFQWQLVP